MSGCWSLPTAVPLGGRAYGIRADFRDVLKIITALEDRELPERIRWLVAVELFYREPIPDGLYPQAAAALADFIRCGQTEQHRPAVKLLDWQQDAPLIVADVNRVAGQEIRALPFVHWWTFIAWFHGIEQGQLSAVVAIRDKLRRGKKLEDWEKDFYRENKHLVDLKTRYTEAEKQQQQRLQKLLGE